MPVGGSHPTCAGPHKITRTPLPTPDLLQTIITPRGGTMPSRVVIRAGGSYPTKSTQRLHACTHQGHALPSATQAETANRKHQTSRTHAEANDMHQPSTKHAHNRTHTPVGMANACLKQAGSMQKPSMHKTCTKHAHNRMPTPEQEQPNACRPHATSMQNACTLQEQAQEARARIPRIPRSRHTPQNTGLTELTNAGVTVDGGRPALV